MAKIETLKLSATTDWRALGQMLLDRQPAEDRKRLLAAHTAKTKATVTMHTKFSWLEGLEHTRKQEQRAKKRAKNPNWDATFEYLSDFISGWTLTDVETGEPLPFTEEGLQHADQVAVAEIVALCNSVEQGNSPNA